MTPREIALLEIQLVRSGNAPLDVFIRFTYNSFHPFLTTLVRHCGRWRTIQLYFAGTWPGLKAFDALGPLPLLKKLRLSGLDVFHLKNFDFFKAAPNLRKVVLSDLGELSIQLPWAQLTSYKATYFHQSPHFRNISASANTLIECDIDFGYGFSPKTAWEGDTLTLPRLRRLVTTADVFLDCLVAPLVQDLYVRGTIAHLLPFLHSSACVSTWLTLFMCDAAASDIILILQNTTSITDLRVDLLGPPPALNELISVLEIRPQLSPLCPNLTSLSWGDRNNYLDTAAFVDMVESRWCLRPSASEPLHSQLRSVAVFVGRARMKAQWNRLRSFADEGLNVVILTARRGANAMEKWREY
ncbi:hypothetical protein FB451DRAFT_1270975 [Mycena latifolia]|nr:hypothetical protein FB451DRAFT_1270975 [Mycena latifolia]